MCQQAVTEANALSLESFISLHTDKKQRTCTPQGFDIVANDSAVGCVVFSIPTNM